MLLIRCTIYVTELIPKNKDHTGGNFSTGYFVEHDDGQKGFLKALDFQRLITDSTPDPALVMQKLTEAFIVERDILRVCREHNLQRIIRSLDDGSTTVNTIAVPYIIFEIAPSDIRNEINTGNEFEIAWILRTIHNVANGLSQLHQREISHQDLKPSNVLIVDNGDRKIGDFGRSITKTSNTYYTDKAIAGDRGYAPPESLYGHIPTEWRVRRCGTDVYQLGSLFVYMITGAHTTLLLIDFLEDQYRPEMWAGEYEDVLPYIEEAFRQVVDVFENSFPEDDIKDESIQILKELCNPDVYSRGDIRKHGKSASRFNLERYVSYFDRLARKYEFKLKKKMS